MKQVDGLINAAKPKPPTPKPSPKDFVWPSQQDHDDGVAKKIGASLQELLPAKQMTHPQLARILWGTDSRGAPRNISKARGWVVADHPIPNAEHAAYLAQVLDVSMERLLNPEGKFDPHPALIRPRSPNGVNLWKSGKKKGAGKTPSGKDRETQRAYNAKYRAKKKAEAAGKKGKPAEELSWYRRNKLKKLKGKPAKSNGNGAAPEGNGGWVLEEGVPVPDYSLSSFEDVPGHVKIVISAVMPQPRAMAILHLLEHQAPEE